MKKGSKITDYDAGIGFGMADVRSLQRQGFSDSEIAKYAHSQVHNAGKGHGNPMSKFMDKNMKLDYHYGDWNKKKGGSGSGGSSGSSGGGKTPGDQANDLLSRYTYEVGKFTHKPRDYGKVASQIANDALRAADARDLPELEALQKSVDRNPLYWKSRSDVQTGDYLGDIWNFDVPDYQDA